MSSYHSFELIAWVKLQHQQIDHITLSIKNCFVQVIVSVGFLFVYFGQLVGVLFGLCVCGWFVCLFSCQFVVATCECLIQDHHCPMGLFHSLINLHYSNVFFINYTLIFPSLMFNSVVQVNISVLISIVTQCLYIQICYFARKIVQVADCFWCYEDTDTKSCNLSVSMYQKSTIFVTNTNSNSSDFTAKGFAVLEHAHFFQSITWYPFQLAKITPAFNFAFHFQINTTYFVTTAFNSYSI